MTLPPISSTARPFGRISRVVAAGICVSPCPTSCVLEIRAASSNASVCTAAWRCRRAPINSLPAAHGDTGPPVHEPPFGFPFGGGPLRSGHARQIPPFGFVLSGLLLSVASGPAHHFVCSCHPPLGNRYEWPIEPRNMIRIPNKSPSSNHSFPHSFAHGCGEKKALIENAFVSFSGK